MMFTHRPRSHGAAEGTWRRGAAGHQGRTGLEGWGAEQARTHLLTQLVPQLFLMAQEGSGRAWGG